MITNKKSETKCMTQAILIAVLSAILFVGGCGSAAVDTAAPNTENPASESTAEKPETPAASKPDENANAAGEGDIVESSNERIGFITQEYDGDNIVEIPYFEYDGDKNPEIDSINRMLNQGLQFSYEEFMENKSEFESIQIKSYPFTTDDYLQVVITEQIYPYHVEFFSDGELESINYDRKANKWITNSDALEMMGLSEDDILTGVGKNFDPEIMGGTIGEVELSGFLIHGAPGDEQIEFLLNITVVDSEQYGEWQGFFSYIPDSASSGELVRINGEWVLFDPSSMDQMDPPLWYQMYDPANGNG